MKIKAKLSFGLGFLFAAFLILGGFSLYFTLKLSKQSRLIMKDNQATLVYAENMLKAIDKINIKESTYFFRKGVPSIKPEFSGELKEFEENLQSESENITEIGEDIQVKLLEEDFRLYKNLILSSLTDTIVDKAEFYYANILPRFTSSKARIFAISDLNMQAMVRKNDNANDLAHHSYLVLSAITTLCLLVYFLFIFGFPDYIARPINELTESVKEIAARNFKTRLSFAGNDEFGEISEAFNKMAAQLDEYDIAQHSLSLNGKERSEAVMNTIPYPIVVLDENKKITFINGSAEKLLNLNAVQVINKDAMEIAMNNETFDFLIRDLDKISSQDNPSIVLDYQGKRTRFIKEVTNLRSGNRDSELMVSIGYMLFLKVKSEA